MKFPFDYIALTAITAFFVGACSERRKAWNPLCEGCAREVSDETENEENEK